MLNRLQMAQFRAMSESERYAYLTELGFDYFQASDFINDYNQLVNRVKPKVEKIRFSQSEEWEVMQARIQALKEKYRKPMPQSRKKPAL